MTSKDGAPRSNFLDVLGPMSPTKEKILLAAIELFAAKGYSAVSVRDLTRAVGIKESSLYNHFRSKEAILETIFALFQEGYRTLVPAVERLEDLLADADLASFLRQGNKLYMNLVEDDVMGSVWRILYMEQYRDERARELFLKQVIEGTLAFLEEVFRHMIARGLVKPHSPALLAAEYQYAVFAMATEYTLLKFQGLDTKDIAEKLDRHVAFFAEAVQNP